jgi:hypothetical protein
MILKLKIANEIESSAPKIFFVFLIEKEEDMDLFT